MEENKDNPLRLDLNALLAYWQPALGLRDWMIRVEYGRDVPGLGVTTVWWRDREARVRICEPSMITREWPPIDIELTFVHELVHCVVEQLMHAAVEMKMPEDPREQPIEQLAKAYVRQHRVFPLEHDWLLPGKIAL